jgi:hypothetical protein
LRLAAVEALHDGVHRRIARKLGDCIDGGFLHFLVDRGGADIERAAKNEWKAEDIVDLVGEVRTTGADHRVGASLAGLIRHDFRGGVGQRHHQRLVRHRLDHVRRQHIGRRQAKENICAADHFGQKALVGFLGIDRLPAIHQRIASLAHHAIDVADPDVLALRPHCDQEIETGDRGRSGAGGDDLDVRKFLAVQQQRIGDGCADDDGGAVLVIVKYRDLHARLQLRLNLETLGTPDVLQVDAAERRLQCGHGLNHTLDGISRDFNVEHVDAREFLEQDRLALHHGLRRQRADIAKAENSSAVGNDRDKIGARGQRRRFRGVFGNRRAGGRHARRIGERQVTLVSEWLGRLNLKLTGPRQAVIGERGGMKIFRIGRHRFPRGLAHPEFISEVRLQVCGRLSRM